jgi:hypothetical protein
VAETVFRRPRPTDGDGAEGEILTATCMGMQVGPAGGDTVRIEGKKKKKKKKKARSGCRLNLLKPRGGRLRDRLAVGIDSVRGLGQTKR